MGAIHITNLHNSVLVTSCRQFRMHASTNVDIYLLCASRPIIEDCQNVRFAPSPAYFTSAEAAQVANQWDQIDDFKWLKAEPSPNFCLLPEAQRVGEDVWRDQVAEHPEGLEQVLQVVGAVKT